MFRRIIQRLFCGNARTLAVTELRQHRSVQRLLDAHGNHLEDVAGLTEYVVTLSSDFGDVTMTVTNEQFNFFKKAAKVNA